mmetsp:Transcript_27030/g.84045  ORF Transcript_27030/g.84045 Transcript_27030/m.84045 type:complete len:84 (+) Transcript_27030:102-353(+)
MLLRYACLGVAAAFIAPSQRSRTALAARRPDVAHKIEIIDGERLDPHSDPSRPRWRYAPTRAAPNLTAPSQDVPNFTVPPQDA